MTHTIGRQRLKTQISRHGNGGRRVPSLLISWNSLLRSPTLECAQATASHIKWSPMCDPHACDPCTHDHCAILTRICPRSRVYRSPHGHRAKARAHHSLVASFPFFAMQISIEREICCVLWVHLTSFHRPTISSLLVFTFVHHTLFSYAMWSCISVLCLWGLSSSSSPSCLLHLAENAQSSAHSLALKQKDECLTEWSGFSLGVHNHTFGPS